MKEEFIRNNQCSGQSRQCICGTEKCFLLIVYKSLGFESGKLADRGKNLRYWHTSCINKSSIMYDVSWRGEIRYF